MIVMVTLHLRLEVVDCSTCGVTFAVPEDLVAARRKTGNYFHCPNGHSLFFPKPQIKVKP